jgi:hypothetical protein
VRTEQCAPEPPAHRAAHKVARGPAAPEKVARRPDRAREVARRPGRARTPVTLVREIRWLTNWLAKEMLEEV